MPTPRTIPHIEALRVSVAYSRVNELKAKKELKVLELQKLDSDVAQLRQEIQAIFDRNGCKGLVIGGILPESDKNLPAGTVLQTNGEPFTLTEPAEVLPPTST